MFAPYGLNFTWGHLSIQNARLVAGWLVKYGGSDRMRMTLTSLVILGQGTPSATNFEGKTAEQTSKDEKKQPQNSRGTYLQTFPLLLLSREWSCLCKAFWKSVSLSDTWWLTRLTGSQLSIKIYAWNIKQQSTYYHIEPFLFSFSPLQSKDTFSSTEPNTKNTKERITKVTII